MCYNNKQKDFEFGARMPTMMGLFDMRERCSPQHHCYPWDYRVDEHSLTTGFIELAASCGLAYDLKTVAPPLPTRSANNRSRPACHRRNNSIFLKATESYYRHARVLRHLLEDIVEEDEFSDYESEQNTREP